METKYYKGVKWLEPFVKLAKGLAPVDRIVIVKGFSVPFSVGQELTGAACSTSDGFRTFTLSVRTSNQIFQKNDNGTFTGKRHKARFIYDILGDLAHEIAHLKEWEHTPEHWLIECKINRRFIAELKRRGVKETTTRNPKDVLPGSQNT